MLLGVGLALVLSPLLLFIGSELSVRLLLLGAGLECPFSDLLLLLGVGLGSLLSSVLFLVGVVLGAKLSLTLTLLGEALLLPLLRALFSISLCGSKLSLLLVGLLCA